MMERVKSSSRGPVRETRPDTERAVIAASELGCAAICGADSLTIAIVVFLWRDNVPQRAESSSDKSAVVLGSLPAQHEQAHGYTAGDRGDG
ncbi:MAG: hypothetical protein WB679_11080 [Terracidiphilus sp.]